MNKVIVAFFLLSFISCKNKIKTDDSTQYLVHQNYDFRIAFGSCSHQDRKQILWDEINNEKPDVWIWLGDNIYGDSEDLSVLKEKYDKQKSDPEYSKLIQNTIVHGVWDDHDYGVNDGGKNFPAKVGAQKALLDFLDVPENSPRRSREGTYYSRDITVNKISVKLICLDTRYFRDDPIRSGNGYAPNLEGSILGTAQWQWLEDEIKNSTAEIHIIASSIQAIPEEHRFEKWDNFPNQRKKLFDLITSNKLKHPIIISGDRHIGEVSLLKWNKQDIYEITSSSLTHGWSKRRLEANKHRVGPLVYNENYGILEFRKKDGQFELNGRLMSSDSKIETELRLFK